jgi:CHAT domain-containing protein
VRAFRPHIFHFTGHGLYDGDKGTLVMGADQGVIVPAENVVTMIDGYGVVLAVLNACDTGNSLTNDAVSSLAGRLVKRGLPAVVASMRQVTDETALMFARDFYTALSMGEPVESAVTEARKALSIENWDWSIYGLFTSLVKLDKLRLPVAARRSE